MASSRRLRTAFALFCTLAGASLCARAAPRRKHGPAPAQVAVHAKPGCKADVDGVAAGTTNAQGNLVIPDVDPSDHYVHVDCPGQPEASYFISPATGETLQINIEPGSASGASALAVAESHTELRKLVEGAADLRADGQFPAAVRELRQAATLDPENPDLHHELGVTFLMVRDWERARVELLESLRYDPMNADSHNGLGYALEKLGEVRPALEQFRAATRLDPSDQSYQDHYLEALGLLSAQQQGKKKKK